MFKLPTPTHKQLALVSLISIALLVVENETFTLILRGRQALVISLYCGYPRGIIAYHQVTPALSFTAIHSTKFYNE